MSQSWAGTSNGYARRLFLGHLKTIVDRLEFADELGLQQHRQHLGGNLVTLERLLLDLFAESTRAGRDGARFFSAVEKLWGQLEACVRAHDQGDLEPWRKARGEVVVQLDALGPEMQSPHVATPKQGAASCPEERANHRDDLSSRVTMSREAKKMLCVLLENDALSPAEGSRLRKEDIMDFGPMKLHAVRKAAKELTHLGLIESFADKRGGYWLASRGVEVARSVAPSVKK